MGLQIKELLTIHETSFEELKGKTLAIDTYNMLYQFLTTIRQRDGTPLMDKDGNITSHLMGLLTRTSSMLEHGIRPVFVFDGKPPELKLKESQRRREAKQEAQRNYEIAKEREDIEAMKKYASRTVKLDRSLIESAKELIALFGCPIVQAASEGEAQAAHLVTEGKAYAVVSQDFDSLLYSTPYLVRNLSVAGRRKVPNKPVFETVNPELISHAENLLQLGIDNDHLIALAMLVGTDYNIGGIKGIGPKKALALVKSHTDIDAIFTEAKWAESFDYPWQDVFELFKNMPVNDSYSIEFKTPDKQGLISFLCDRHGFSAERVESLVGPLCSKKQKGLADFF
jgi:flap endonuclease-1